MKSREQAWYHIAPDSEEFDLDNDSKINMDQIVSSYKELSVAIDSANKKKLAGISSLKVRMDTAIELFLLANYCKIKKEAI